MSKLLYFVVILGSFVLLHGVGRAWKLKPESQYDHSLYDGEIAVLTIQGADADWLAFDKNDCYSMSVAMAHKDSSHLQGCEDARTAFAVPAGTLVKVTGAFVSRKHLEVLDGPLARQDGLGGIPIPEAEAARRVPTAACQAFTKRAAPTRPSTEASCPAWQSDSPPASRLFRLSPNGRSR